MRARGGASGRTSASASRGGGVRRGELSGGFSLEPASAPDKLPQLHGKYRDESSNDSQELFLTKVYLLFLTGC